MNHKKKLLELRNYINYIDKKILILLSNRKKITIKIIKEKIINNIPIQDKKREKEILKKLFHMGKKYFLSQNYIEKIFKNIIQESVITQKKIKNQYMTKNIFKIPQFSILGPQGSYSHIAMIKYAKKKFKYFNIKTYLRFQKIFQSINNKTSNFAIIPIENTYSGFIHETYNLLCLSKLHIIDELNIPIQHYFMTNQFTDLKNIKIIYSHPQPFEQCSKFIKKFNHLTIKYTNSTSDAIKKIIQNHNIYSSAIGNKENIKIYKLKEIKKNITNQIHNSTRFLVLKNKNIEKFKTDISKIICIININKKIELINQILFIFNTNQLNILKIELKSNNHNNMLENTIYIEIQTYLSLDNMLKIFTKFKKQKILFKILGYCL
ncbi:Bifunctional chorismate mutase/prephenate dehydratase [Buchnera aphidicola (Phyllaphis fagi)]|uniref:chorismate mutase n=1 Tax=Buchnera aphidicola TaxID=9 RepID=UPI003463F083